MRCLTDEDARKQNPSVTSNVTGSLEAERRWAPGVPEALLHHTGWFSSWVGVWLGRDFWECDGLKHNNRGKSWLKSPLERFSNKSYCRDGFCTSGLFRTHPLWPATPLGFLSTRLPAMVPSALPAPAFPHLGESEASRTFCMRCVPWGKSSSILYPKHVAAWYCGRSEATAPGWVALSQWKSPPLESKKGGQHDHKWLGFSKLCERPESTDPLCGHTQTLFILFSLLLPSPNTC